MKKREQGVLTVEASIVLTVCILFILFLFSFARIYSAQSMVGHAVIQASDAIALESYFREETRTGSEADVTELANRFLGTTSITADNYTSLRSADVPAIAREKFILAIDSNEAKADEKLRRLGVKDGISGIDFSRSNIELGPDDVIVHVTYKLEMQFSVFGMNEITVTKAAKSKTFGDILFDIEVAPENSLMGETNGSGNFRQGRSIRISATPKYGYKFKQWSDGNTDNPRTVTVSGTGRYVAIFEESAFGVNLVSSPSSGGQVTGGGEYKYQQTSTITATASEGYHFVRWSIYSHKDKTTRNVTASTTTIHVDQSYTATAYFERNSYTAMVETSGASGTANFIYKGEVKTNAAVLYNDTIRLSAPDISGYKLLGWKEQDGDRYFSTSAIVDVSMPAKNVTYVACYESLSRTVNFYNYDGSLYATRTVIAGNSLGSSMPSRPYYSGRKFNGWNGFSSSTVVYNNVSVYGNWSRCSHTSVGHCGQKHPGTANNVYRPGHMQEYMPGSHYRYYLCCAVCVDCGKYQYGLCGTCTSWKRWQWVNVHGLAQPDNLTSKYY